MSYRLSTLAEQDLEEIWSYVADDASVTRADRLIDAIFDRFELLAEQPAMGRNRPEFGEGTRSFVVVSYIAPHEVREDLDRTVPRHAGDQATIRSQERAGLSRRREAASVCRRRER